MFEDMTRSVTEGLLEAGLAAPLAQRMDAVAVRLAWRTDPQPTDPVVRVAGVGALYHDNDAELYAVARASSLLTHPEQSPVGAIAAAYLVKLALTGAHLPQYLSKTLTFCEGISEDFEFAMLRIGHVLGWANEHAALRHIGQPDNTDLTVALALYCVMRYDDDESACVRLAGHPAVAAVAGSIVSVRLGRRPDLEALARR